MTLIEEIEKQLHDLPLEKQGKVLEFILLLQKPPSEPAKTSKRRSLKAHPAFGMWHKRHVDGIAYQQVLRSEWGA